MNENDNANVIIRNRLSENHSLNRLLLSVSGKKFDLIYNGIQIAKHN